VLALLLRMRVRAAALQPTACSMTKQPYAHCKLRSRLIDTSHFPQVADLTMDLNARNLELQGLQLSSEAALRDQTAAAHAERQAAAAANAAAVARLEQVDAELTRCRAAAEQELRLRLSAEQTSKQHAEVHLLHTVDFRCLAVKRVHPPPEGLKVMLPDAVACFCRLRAR